MRRLVIAAAAAALFFPSEQVSAQSDIWVSAYYAGWSQGWHDNGVLPSGQIDFHAVTHIIHFGLVPRADGTVDDQANSVHRANSQALIDKAHAAGKKVLICVGGWGTDHAFRGATSLLTRPSFIKNLIAFMTDRGYDGIDIDWEILELSDMVQYTAFITELRARMNQITPRPLLTAVTSWQAPIFTMVAGQLDQVNLMTYDLSGAWPGWVSWHNAPLRDGGYRFASNGRLIPSADNMIDEFIAEGIPRNKLGIGIDFYGYIWNGGTGTPTGGMTAPRQSWDSPPFIQVNVPYYSLMKDQYRPSYYRWDSSAHASYLSVDQPGSSNDKFISYDNEQSIKAKIEYARLQGIGGVIIWELGGGMLPAGFSNRDRLLRTVGTARRGDTVSLRPPDALDPVNAAEGVPLTPLLRWTVGEDISWNRLQLSADSAFSSVVIDQPWIIEPSYTGAALLPEQQYFWRVQSSNAFTESGWSAPARFTTTPDPFTPSWWQFAGSTGSNAIILIPSTVIPVIGRKPLRNGDLIGVFFRRGDTAACAGYIRWQQGANTSITAWGDNLLTPVKDGFAPGDTVFFRFWDRTNGREHNAAATFSSGKRTYEDDGISTVGSLSSLADAKHRIALHQGWNMISTYIHPNDPSVESVTAEARRNMVVMKDNDGNVFWPDSGVNTIGSWNGSSGYQLFMRTSDTMIVTGELIDPESSPIPLTAGWNMAAYLRTSPMRADSAFASILPAMILAKDNAGNIFWPEYGINTIGALTPGEGYRLSLKRNALLVYPANQSLADHDDLLLTLRRQRFASPGYYQPDISATANNSVLLIQSPELRDGDEIGAWSSDGTLIGSGMVSRGNCLVSIWGTNRLVPGSKGAHEGEEISLTVWESAKRRESRLTLTMLKDGITGMQRSPQLRFESESVLIGKTKTIPRDHYLEQNYPNPFNAGTVIAYGIAEETKVLIEVFNAAGQRMAVLRASVQAPGEYRLTFNGSHLASGAYLVRLTAGTAVHTRKMMLIR